MPPCPPLFHVVLYQPDIPQNTGNIGRTCVAVGAKLWLIRPLGFRMDERSVRRACLDYWKYLDFELLESWAELQARLPGHRVWCVTKTGSRLAWEADFQPQDILLFGNETRGLPQSILAAQPARNIRLPMRDEVRSLNLATTVNTIVYEGVRQLGGLVVQE